MDAVDGRRRGAVAHDAMCIMSPAGERETVGSEDERRLRSARSAVVCLELEAWLLSESVPGGPRRRARMTCWCRNMSVAPAVYVCSPAL